MKPTPGPWKAVKYPDVQSTTIHAGGLSIGRMATARDAVLAAASPELFACVAAFVGEFGFDVECDEAISGADAVDWISQNMRDFRNALNKARGLR